MDLVFDIVSAEDYAPELKSSRTFHQVGGMIGRAEDADWQLPDTKRFISNHHLQVSFDDGHYYLTDQSTNGTVNSRTDEHLPKGQAVEVQHGDRIKVGGYLLQARLIQDPKLFHHDAGQPVNQHEIIPDDDFLDLDPLNALEQQNIRYRETEQFLNGSSESEPQPQDLRDSMMGHLTVPELTPEKGPEQSAEPIQPAVTKTHSGPAQSFERTADDSELVAILSQALELDLSGYQGEQLKGVIRQVGVIAKEAVRGLQQSLKTRSELKNQLRLEMTTIQSQSNNALKFCGDYRQVMQTFVEQHPGYLKPEISIRQAYRDIQAHQVASFAACQASLDSLFNRLAPQELTYRFESEIRRSRWSKPDARYWQSYTKLHHQLETDDEWRASLISKDYAKAYEQQVRLLNTASSEFDS